MITAERMADAIFARRPNNGFATAVVVYRPTRSFCRAVVRFVHTEIALTERDRVDIDLWRQWFGGGDK